MSRSSEFSRSDRRLVEGIAGVTETVRVCPWQTRVVVGSAVCIVALGLMVLAGWFSHTPVLVQVLPQLPPMTRNAAACFLLCGLALLMLALRSPRWPVVVCAGIAGAVSLLTIFEFAFGVNAGIDELLGPSYIAVKLSSPGRMSPVAAICFALSAMALLLAPRILSKGSALLLGLNGSIIAAVGMATSMGFALGSSDVFGWGGVTRQALPTAVGFWILGFGMVALAWHVETDPAGTPRWLPISVAIGVVTGALGLWQAIIAGGQTPFAPLPAVVLGGGCLMAPIVGLTLYLAQRAHAQTAELQRHMAQNADAERRTSLAVDAGQMGTWELDLATDTSVRSLRHDQIFGYTTLQHEWGAKNLSACVVPEDLAAVHHAFEEALRTGAFSLECRIRWPDTSLHWISRRAGSTATPRVIRSGSWAS